MNEKITWIVITDGYFIKIMLKSNQHNSLKTLRDNDFEHTSNITYNLVTNKRNIKAVNDEEPYFVKLLATFLLERFENKAFNDLVLVAPDNVLEIMRCGMPNSITRQIKVMITGDYLYTTQDKIEEYMKRL
jgi:hypothetical protein